jgi:hypothetical protein
MQLFFVFFSLLLCTSLFAELNTWPQWRGPNRDGQGIANIHLFANIDETTPRKLWESIEIPSQDDGGFGSVISDGKRAYLSVVWHRDEPTEERILNSLVMRKLGLRKLNLPPELKEKAEKDRLSLNPRLRGSKLDEWINQWIVENLDQKQKMTQGALITSRFKQGKLAIPLWVIDRMFTIMDRVFASQKEFDQWLDEQGFPEQIRERISQDVPPTKKMANDVLLALDLTEWETNLENKFIGSAIGTVFFFDTLPCRTKNICGRGKPLILCPRREWEITLGICTWNRSCGEFAPFLQRAGRSPRKHASCLRC